MTYVSSQFEIPIGRSDHSEYVRSLQLDIDGCDRNGELVLLGKMAADQVMVSDSQGDGNILMPNACWGDGRKSIVRNETDASRMLKTLADRASRNQKC